MELRDLFENPLSEVEIRDLLNGRRPADTFSWKSPSFKALDLEVDSLDDDDLVCLMVKEPRLIRRPMVLVEEELVIGGGLEALEAALDA